VVASASGGSETSQRSAGVLCSGTEVRGLVSRFVRAFNGGDLKQLDRLFARAEDFQWYSTPAPGARLNAKSGNRESLLPYFKKRHTKGERLNLRRFKFGGNGGGYGHFEYRLIRRADDLSPTLYDGKGAVLCWKRPHTIAVWSMGPV
jgi:hypothetical protein